jgi:hypothetical protein
MPPNILPVMTMTIKEMESMLHGMGDQLNQFPPKIQIVIPSMIT